MIHPFQTPKFPTMLHRSGTASADDELRVLLGSSQDQSYYAALATNCLSSGEYSHAAPQTTLNRHTSPWSTGTNYIDPAVLVPTFSAGPSDNIGFGSSLHLDSLYTPQARSYGTYNTLPEHHNSTIAHKHSPSISRRKLSLEIATTPNSTILNARGMQSNPSEHQCTGDVLSENDTPNRESLNSGRKRSRRVPSDSTVLEEGQISKSPRANKSLPERRTSSGSFGSVPIQRTGSIYHQQLGGHTNRDITQAESLSGKQKKFIRTWYDTFARSENSVVPSDEFIGALSTLTQAPPQLVFEYTKKKYHNTNGTDESSHMAPPGTGLTQLQDLSHLHSEAYTLATANSHLQPRHLDLIQKYLNACRRTRPHTDGRRSVNTGPYRCTFGCGYRTKRSFDWRRHEETHEPQELWLCTICPSNDKKELFMVSRKDKFLKHAKEAHKNWPSEEVLRLSRVDYRPRQSLACPMTAFCAWKGDKGWDERCKHVLGHFEDEVERKLKRPRAVCEEVDETKVSAEERAVSESVVSDGSDDGSETSTAEHAA